MSPKQQQIAIAKACNWKQVTWDNKPEEIWEQITPFYCVSAESKLPDYLNDLNAMHQAEKVLTQEQMIDYSRYVGKTITSHLPASRAAWMDFKLIHVTAAQKSKAFLQTLGLWTESPTQPQ